MRFEFPRNDAAGGPGGVIPEVWNDSEWLQWQLLTCRRIPNDTSTKKVRKMLSYAMTRRPIARPARAIVEAANELVGLGILERIGIAPDSLQHGGWPSFSFRKRRWSEVEGNENARAHLSRIRVAGDYFDG